MADETLPPLPKGATLLQTDTNSLPPLPPGAKLMNQPTAPLTSGDEDRADSFGAINAPKEEYKEPDFSGPIREFHKSQLMPNDDENTESFGQLYGRQQVAELTNKDVAFFKDRSIPYADKQAKAVKMVNQLQEQKKFISDVSGVVDTHDLMQQVSAQDQGYLISPEEQERLSKVNVITSKINALQQALGSTGQGGAIPLLVQIEGENAKKAIENPDALAGMTDKQILENAGLTGVRVRTIASLDSDGKPDGKYKELAYTNPITFDVTTDRFDGSQRVRQDNGMSPLDRKSFQRDGIFQDIGTLSDHIQQKQEEFKDIVQKHNDLVKDYNNSPSQEASDAIADYDSKVYNPANQYIEKQIGNIKRLESIAKSGFSDLTASENEAKDRNRNYVQAIESLHNDYKSGFIKGTAKGILDGKLLELYAPAIIDATYNEVQRAGWGVENLIKTPFANTYDYLSTGTTNQAKADTYASQSRLRDELFAVPERYLNPELFHKDEKGNNILTKVNWVEAGPLAMKTTLQSLEIAAATSLTGMAAVGLTGATEAGAMTAAMRTAIVPVTAAMTYGDFLYSNIESGLNPNQAAALSLFQSLVEGVTERFSPMEAKIFNPEYWSTHALTYNTRKGVMRELFKSLTGKELSEAAEKTLLQSSKDLFTKFSGDAALNFGVTAAKGVAQGGYTVVQETVEELAADLLNAPFNKVADKYIRGYQYQDVNDDSLLYTTMSSAITMLPTGLFGAGSTMLHKQLPGFRLAIANNADMYQQMLDYDFVGNKISKAQYERASKEIQRIKDLGQANSQVLNNLDDKVERADYINTLVGQSKLAEHMASSASAVSLNNTKEGITVSPFLTQVPEYIGTGKNKRLNTEKRTNAELYAIELEKYQEHINKYTKKAYDNASLSKEERLERQESQILKATKDKFTDDFIDNLWDERQVRFHQSDLVGRAVYMPTEKVQALVKDINAKLDAKAEELKQAEKDNKPVDVELDLTPKTETITVGGKDYNVTYNENFEVAEFRNPDGTPVEDDTEKQAIYDHLYDKVDKALAARAEGLKPEKAPTTVKIRTKDGLKEYQIGKPYFVGKLVTEDSDGHKLVRFQEITILGSTPDGSITIQEPGKQPRQISTTSLADYKLGSKEGLTKNKIAKFYFDNANIVFEYKFGNGVKRTGRIEYDASKKELLFVYKDKNGKVQNRELTEKDLVPQKGFTEARLEPKEDDNGKPIDLAAKERIRKQQAETALADFAEAKKRLLERRSSILQDFLEKKQKVVDRIKTKIANIEARLAANEKDTETTQKDLAFFWKQRDKDFQGVSKTKLGKKIGELLEFGRNLETEKAELEEEFKELQEKLDNATRDLVATEDVLTDFDEDLDDTELGLSAILSGRLANYKSILKEAKKFIRDGDSMIKKIVDTIESVKNLVFSIIDSIEKRYPGLTDLSKEDAEDFIESGIEYKGKDKRSKTRAEKTRVREKLAEIDENVEELDNQEAALEALKKRIVQARREVTEFTPKIKVLTQLLKEVKAKETVYNSEKAQKKREAAKKTLGMEARAASDTSSDVSTGDPVTDAELVPYSEAQKALEVLFNSTVTPDQLADPAVARLVNALNKMATPVVKDGKIDNTQLKPYHKLLLITKDNAAQYGLEKIVFDDSHILGVLVADFANGLKFLDENLEQIETPTHENVVYASLPKAELTWSTGQYEGQNRYFENKETTPEYKEALRAKYEAERQTILDDIKAGKKIMFTITGVSEGFPVKSEPASNHPIQGRLITQEVFDLAIEEGRPIIVIPTSRDPKNPKVGPVSATGDRVVNMPIGRPVLQVGSAVRFLNNRKLTAKEKDVIKGLLQLLVIRAAKNMEKNEEGGNILDTQILDFLKRVLYWKIPAEGTEMGRNQIYLETYNGDARFVLGTNRIEVPFDINEIQSSVTLDAFLDEVFNNVDSQLLNALSPTTGTKTQVASFFEITEVDVAKDTFTGRKWDTYQEYLLSNKNPDGTVRKAEDIPLTTNADPMDSKKPNIKGRYFTVQNPVEAKPTSTIATDDANPEDNTIVYQDTVYKEVKKGVNSYDLIKLLRENNPDRIFVTRLPNGQLIKYITNDDNLGITVLELPVGATKTLEELSQGFSNFLKTDGEVADLVDGVTGQKFDTTLSRHSTTVFEKTDKKVDTTQENTPTTAEPSVKDAQEKARNRRKRINEDSDSNTRLMTRKVFYETEDFKAFKKWFEANFPDTISVEQVPHVINGIAMGQFQKNAIKIYQFAEKGTGFHEAFEAVWNAFLSPVEREALLNEFKRRSGTFTEYNTGKKIAYSKATISQAKEEMAEEFRRFRLTGEQFKGAVKQNHWFRRLVNFIRNILFGKPGTIKDIQDRMSNAYYKTKSSKWSASIPLFKSSNNYRTFNPDDLHSIKFYSEVMDGMTALMFARLSKSGSITSILRGGRALNTIYHDVKFDLQQHYIGKGEFYQKFFPLYQAGNYQGILDLIDESPIEETSNIINKLADFYNEDVLNAKNADEVRAALDDFKSALDDYVNQWTKINNNYPEFVADHKEHLEQYNLRFEQEEVSEEEKYTNEYAEDVLALSSKDNANAAIKLLIGSLVEKKIRPNGRIVDNKAEITSLPKLVDYGQTWATLLNELAGTRNIQEQIDKLKELIPTHPEFEKLIEKLGVFNENMTNEQMALRVQFEGIFHKLRPNYFRFIYTTETNDKGFVTGYKMYRINSSTENEIERVKNDWVSAMRDKNFITTNADGNKVINIKKLAEFEVDVNNFKNNKKWLEHLGWTFDAPLTDDQIKDFNNIVSALRNSFLNEKDNILLDRKSFSGRLRSLALLYVKANSKFTDTQHFNIEGKPQQNTILDNFVSIHFKDFNSAKTLEDFLNTVPAFKNSAFSKGSQLLKKGGLFFRADGTRRNNPLVLGVAEGIKKEQDTEGEHTSELTLTARLLAEFNHNLHGSYYAFVPADIKTEFPIDFGYFFDINDLKDENSLSKKIWDIFSEYLIDEINVIQDYNNKGIGTEYVSFNEKYVSSDKLVKGQQLQLFRTILPEKQVTKLTAFANNSKTREEARIFVEKIRPELLKSIEEFIQEISSETYNDFVDRRIIGENNKGYFQLYGGDTDKLLDLVGKVTTFTERDMQQLVKFRTLNYVTANIEQFKFMFSDPLFWKDPLKRTKSFLGSREHSVNGLDASNEFNTWAKNNLNTLLSPEGQIRLRAATVKDGKISLESRGFMTYDGKFQKITLSDVTLVSEMYHVMYNEKVEMYTNQEFPGKTYEDLTPTQKETVDNLVNTDEELLTYSPFGDINEADAQGGITLPAFRELLWRAGKWTDEQEIMYQYEMSYERQALAKTGKYEYTDEALKAYDEQVMEAGDPSEDWDDDKLDRGRFQVLKPLKAGYSINDQVLAPSLDKYSLSPMYFRLLEKSENGLSMYNQMMDQGVNYFIFESGNKVGGLATRPGTTAYHKVYNNEGKVVEQTFTKEANDYKYIGIQVETPAKRKTTRGTQITKQILSNLFDNSIESVPFDAKMSNAEWKGLNEEQRREASNFYNLYKENKELLLAWVAVGRSNLFNKLGIKELNGGLYFSDPELISEFLRQNMKGNKSENIKQLLTVKDGAFYLPLDATPVSQKIQNIIFSYIDSAVIRPKMFGGSKPQVASTFFEQSPRSHVYISDKTGKYTKVTNFADLSQTEKTSVRLTSNDLQFYKEKNGKITGIEVYLPWYYKGKIDLGKIDKSLLSGVGFRIPTQSLASAENLIIKGFLPKSMGDAIVVPSEITGKAGSDFDIDKLNLYLFESVFKGGKYVKIPYLDDDNSTPEQRYITYIMDVAERDEIDYISKLSAGEFGRLRGEFNVQLTKIKARLATLKKAELDKDRDIYINERQALRNILDAEKEEYINDLFVVGKQLFRTLNDDLKQLFWDNHANNLAKGLKGASQIASHKSLALDALATREYQSEEEKETLNEMIDIYNQQLKAFTNSTQFDAFFNTDLKKAKERMAERRAMTKDLFKYQEGKEKGTLTKIYSGPRMELELASASIIASMGNRPTLAEFRRLPILQQNTESALKNKYIENLQQLLSLPENKRNLLSPNSARTLQRLADEVEAAEKGVNVKELKAKKKAELANQARLLNPNYMAKTRQAFLVGKAGVGITAVNATNHILNTIAGTFIGKNPSFIKFPYNTKVVLINTATGKKVEMKLPSLAFAKDKAGNWISDNLSEFLNAYVDVAKDPFIISLNAGISNSSTFMFMNKIGIPMDDIAWFMNQPILKELTKLEDITKSYHTEMNPYFTQQEVERQGKKVMRKTLPRYRKSNAIAEEFKFKNYNFEAENRMAPRTRPYTLNELKKAVADYHKLKSGKVDELPVEFYRLQWNVYQDYFKFKDSMSQEMTNVISVTPFDTKQFNSLGKARVMLERYEALQINSSYGNLDKYMRSLHLDAIKDLYPDFLQAFGNLFFTEHPKTRAILDRALKPIVATTKGEKTFELADYMSKEFITYVLTTTKVHYDGKERPLSDFIVPMFIGENNMASKLASLIRRIKNKEIDPSRALDELSPVVRNNASATRNIRMWTSKFTAPELNQIYYEFLAMADSEDPEVRRFKDNLTSFVLLQSGINNSPLNFSRFLPIEDFGTIAKPIFAKFQHMEPAEFETFLQQVIANNPKIFGLPVEDKSTIVNSSGLVNFDTSNPEFAGSDFMLLPYDEPKFNRSSVYVNTTVDRTINKENRDKMKESNDWSFLKQSIFMEVVDGEGNSVLYVDDSDKKYYIYREIPPLGDGMYLKEYYSTDRQSVLRQNNKFRITETEEGTQEEQIQFPTNADMLKYLAERQADSNAKNEQIKSEANVQSEEIEEDQDMLALPVAMNDFVDAEYEDVTPAKEEPTEETPKEDFNPNELKPCD